MTTPRLEQNSLSIEIAKVVAKMIEDRTPLKEIGKTLNVHGNTLNAWISEALLSSNIDPPHSVIRKALIQRTLKDTAILGLLKAASEPSETKAYKTTILSELSKADKTLLEQQGYQSFINQIKPPTIILKVEETVTSIAPDTSLYKEILKALDNGDIESHQQLLTDFNPPHKDLPPV